MTCPPVLFICRSPQNGDAHWRVSRPAAQLAAAGVDARVSWLGPSEMPTQPVAGRVVVLQQVVAKGGPDAAQAWTDRLRAAGAIAVVYDTDDDEWSGSHIDHQAATHPISASDREELERRRQARIDTLRACDGATASTEPLAAVVRRYTDRPVIVVPNAIDVEWFRARLVSNPFPDVRRDQLLESVAAPALTIGWAGWRRPDADLEPMAEAWERIARRYPEVRFVVAGHQPDAIYRRNIPLDRIIRLPIAPLDDYPPLHQVDIGCCAVADSPFSRCKTPIKAWEYELAGAVTVGTPTLYEGHTAFTAATVDEWENLLSNLIRRPAVREVWADAGREVVEEDHSLATQLHRWQDAYRSIVTSVSGKILVQNASA